MKSSDALPVPVIRALRKIGGDLRDARRRRRIPTEIMAARIGMSRTTLSRLEKGDHRVAVGTYATALFVLGLIQRLNELADVRHDSVGLDLADEALPQRIRKSTRREKR